MGMHTIQTFISPAEVVEHLGDPHWVIIDARFSFVHPDQGRKDYQSGHLPGAVYAHLEDDLSGPVIPGVTGRHPLPSIEAAAKTFGGWGIEGCGSEMQVVVYDEAAGASAAGRAGWMLRWLGQEKVAVLDGGLPRWKQAGNPLTVEIPPARPCVFQACPHPEMLASIDEAALKRHDPAYRLLDSRAAERYHGRNETIYPVAGHIPGARSAPYMDNLTAAGEYKPVDELRERFQGLVGETPAQNCIFYCGSGVTATVNILAMAHAGLGQARLFVGSWSEWIADSHRPIATDQV